MEHLFDKILCSIKVILPKNIGWSGKMFLLYKVEVKRGKNNFRRCICIKKSGSLLKCLMVFPFGWSEYVFCFSTLSMMKMHNFFLQKILINVIKIVKINRIAWLWAGMFIRGQFEAMQQTASFKRLTILLPRKGDSITSVSFYFLIVFSLSLVSKYIWSMLSFLLDRTCAVSSNRNLVQSG